MLSNHNHHARNKTYLWSNKKKINGHQEEPKNLKHVSIQPYRMGAGNPIKF